LAEALRFIAKENPDAARALSRRFDEVLRVLGRFPEAGTIQPNGIERILQAKGTPYWLIYRSDLAEVVILRIWHGARGWPPVS
jgi:plasmid stabilization system protein ParE